MWGLVDRTCSSFSPAFDTSIQSLCDRCLHSETNERPSSSVLVQELQSLLLSKLSISPVKLMANYSQVDKEILASLNVILPKWVLNSMTNSMSATELKYNLFKEVELNAIDKKRNANNTTNNNNNRTSLQTIAIPTYVTYLLHMKSCIYVGCANGRILVFSSLVSRSTRD